MRRKRPSTKGNARGKKCRLEGCIAVAFWKPLPQGETQGHRTPGMLPSLRRFGTHNNELVIDLVHDCFLLVVYPVISAVPVVVQPANMGTISAVCTRRLVVLDICHPLLSRLMCMTGRAARLPLCCRTYRFCGPMGRQ